MKKLLLLPNPTTTTSPQRERPCIKQKIKLPLQAPARGRRNKAWVTMTYTSEIMNNKLKIKCFQIQLCSYFWLRSIFLQGRWYLPISTGQHYQSLAEPQSKQLPNYPAGLGAYLMTQATFFRRMGHSLAVASSPFYSLKARHHPFRRGTLCVSSLLKGDAASHETVKMLWFEPVLNGAESSALNITDDSLFLW